MSQQGTISVHTENIFPIIKKFLYSDHEIFIRELVSNAVDATQKLKALSASGEAKGELGDLKIKIVLDEKAGTITITDKGIGMTADEINKYINQIAFSGAEEFVEKYKDKLENGQVIGHFGLGFYSSFMVASKVEIITKSFRENSTGAKWTCDGSTTYTIEDNPKSERGTEIVLHIAEDSKEFLEKSRIQNILSKYCKFLPIEIEFDDKAINNTQPIWKKKPADLKPEDYTAFYNELYPFAEAPLFWIHLNVDYPFNLTGVLYFPKIKPDVEPQKNKIQLYSNQVFVTDEVKEIVPEFLMLLHGVIDSPDIPLNISRSYLQSDSRVKQINSHITKKVADKLNELFTSDRSDFESKWENVSLFVKYGMITDEKFAERARKFCLLQDSENKYFTLDEYIEKVKPMQTDKEGKTVLLYTTDATKQHAFVAKVKERGYDVLRFDGLLDNHFIGHLEMKLEKVSLKRVDAETPDKLIDKDEKHISVLTKDEETKVKELFENAVSNVAYKVEVSPLGPEDDFVNITKPEWERRMKDMSGMGGMAFFGSMPDTHQIVVNANHKLAKKILSDEADSSAILRQCIDLAKLSQNLLTGEELTTFIKRNQHQLEI